MSIEQLVVEQQLEIRSLKQSLAIADELADNIRSILYCIGGPLNDNKLGYTKEQLSTFFEIAENLPAEVDNE